MSKSGGIYATLTKFPQRAIVFLAICLTILNNYGQSAPDSVIKVIALGRTARLGELYNINRDEFTHVSILSEKIPRDYEVHIGTPKTRTAVGSANSLSDKALQLGIGFEIGVKASGDVGTASASAGGRFLVNTKDTEDKATVSFTYTTETQLDMVEIFYDDMRKRISESILYDSVDSHVVVGIGYGAHVCIRFDNTNTTGNTSFQAEYHIKAAMNKMLMGSSGSKTEGKGKEESEADEGTEAAVGASVELSINASAQLHAEFDKLSLSIFGDIDLNGADYPTNAIKTLQLIRQIPKLVSLSNDGKGKQMYFYLMPIERIRKFMDEPDSAEGTTLSCSCERSRRKRPPRQTGNVTYQEIPDGVLEVLIQGLEHAELVGKKMADLVRLLSGNEGSVNATVMRRIRKSQVDLLNRTEVFKKRVSIGLALARKNKKDKKQDGEEDLDFFKLTKNFREGDPEIEGDVGLYAYEDVIEKDFRDDKLKTKMVELIRKLGSAVWVGRGVHHFDYVLANFLNNIDRPMCIIHYYYWYLDKVLDFVLKVKFAQATNNAVVYVIDCDFDHPTCNLMTSKHQRCVNLFDPDKPDL